MIVNSPLIYDLTQGQQTVIPTEEDTVIAVPPHVLPAVLFLQTSFKGNPAAVARKSVIESMQVAVPASTAAQSITVAILARGLWEIEQELSYQSSFTGTPAAPIQVSTQLQYQNNFILTSTLFAHVGDASHYTRWRYLFSEDANFQFVLPATGAGQTITARINLNAIRIL